MNKVETRVELIFNLNESEILTESQKAQLRQTWSSRLDSTGAIRISCQESRSQARNKELVIKRFYHMLESALRKRKKRIPTRTPRAAKEAILKKKKRRSELKSLRRKPGLD